MAQEAKDKLLERQMKLEVLEPPPHPHLLIQFLTFLHILCSISVFSLRQVIRPCSDIIQWDPQKNLHNHIVFECNIIVIYILEYVS